MEWYKKIIFIAVIFCLTSGQVFLAMPAQATLTPTRQNDKQVAVPAPQPARPVSVDWSKVDWDGEIATVSDWEANQRRMNELANKAKPGDTVR